MPGSASREIFPSCGVVLTDEEYLYLSLIMDHITVHVWENLPLQEAEALLPASVVFFLFGGPCCLWPGTSRTCEAFGA